MDNKYWDQKTQKMFLPYYRIKAQRFSELGSVKWLLLSKNCTALSCKIHQSTVSTLHSKSIIERQSSDSQQVFDFYSNRYEQGSLKASSYWLLVSKYRLLGWRVRVVAWCEYKLWQVTKTFSRELLTFSVFF